MDDFAVYAVGRGIDTNGNGVLHASEITKTQNVCNAAPSSLVTTTTLSSGNANRPTSIQDLVVTSTSNLCKR